MIAKIQVVRMSPSPLGSHNHSQTHLKLSERLPLTLLYISTVLYLILIFYLIQTHEICNIYESKLLTAVLLAKTTKHDIYNSVTISTKYILERLKMWCFLQTTTTTTTKTSPPPNNENEITNT